MQFGRYQVVEPLGKGGMGTVYVAYDPQFDRQVALKVLSADFLLDPSFRRRFDREAKLIAQLEHKAIVPVYDYGEDQGRPFLVMRLMTGGTLSTRMEAGPLTFPVIEDILQRICGALDKAHERSIIHRDIKPDNILFDEDGAAYLADFGIARLASQTNTVALVGTPSYMAPEQIASGEIDRQSDVYQLGIILFQMLAGDLPFKADSLPGLAYHHVHTPVPSIRAVNPALPPAIEPVIQKAMAKEKKERYPTAGALAGAFSQAVGEETTAGTVPVPAQVEKEPSPNRTRTFLGVGCLLVLLVLCGVLTVAGIMYVRGNDDSSFVAGRNGTATATMTAAAATNTTMPSRTVAPTPENSEPAGTEVVLLPIETPAPTQTARPTQAAAPTQTAAPNIKQTAAAGATSTAAAERLRGATATATSLPPPPPPSPPAGNTELEQIIADWDVIVDEGFGDNRNNWLTGPIFNSLTLSGTVSITGGEYVWEIATLQNDVPWVTGDFPAVADFYAEVEADTLLGFGAPGLTYGHLDSMNFYVFGICIDQVSYNVGVFLEGVYTDLLPCTISEAIVPNGVNKLGILRLGNDAFFYLNDVLVDSWQDNRLPTGNVGLALGLPAFNVETAYYDNFELREPE